MAEIPEGLPDGRIQITTHGGGDTVQHWQLSFDGLFLSDTDGDGLEKWLELAEIVNGHVDG